MDISSLLEVEVKEGKASDLQNNGEIAAYKNIPDFSIRDIASVRFRKLHCTACDLHIGSAPAEAHNMHEHPILHVLLCTACRNFYGDGTFEQGDDATDMFCRWCANGGNLYCCSYCSNTFCYNCIKRNFDPMIRKKIERDEKWKCFVCNPADLYSARASCWALLQHVQTVTRILQSDRKMSPKEIEAKMELDESQCCPHRNKRKRSETISDDEEQDETYNVPKRKRRKLINAKRKRRVIKLEQQDGTSDHGSLDSTNNRGTTERVAMRELDDHYLTDTRRNRTDNQRSGNEKTSNVSPEELPLAVRQRNRRLREESMSLAKFSINDDEIPPPLLQCDQSMIEGAESLTFGVPQVVGRATTNIGISPVPMVNLMKRPTPPSGPLTRGGKTHRLIRGIGGTPVLVRKIAPSNSQNPGNSSSTVQSLPMVTIPSRNHMQTSNRPSVIQAASKTTQETQNSIAQATRPMRPRPTLQKSKNVPPSVIDLDSDSDEPVVIMRSSRDKPNSSGNDRVSGLSTVTYPVRPEDGLMTILTTTAKTSSSGSVESSTDICETEGENTALKTFDKTIREPTKSIDGVLDTLKNKLKKVMESTILCSSDNELLAAKAKTRAVNRTIKRTVAELTSLNDHLVRAYHAYKRDRTKEKIHHTETIRLEPRQKSGKLTPLDMECTRESEAEFDEAISDDDDDDDDDAAAEEARNLLPFREIRPFRRRVHRAVEARPQTKNKSIQVYDAELRDCEKSIGYALLLKADYDPKRERDILRPVMVPDENFGKYEEEFISYLQHIEDHGIETEETKEQLRQEQPDSAGASINQLVEADISAIIKEITSSDGSKNFDVTRETMNDENVEILEEHVEILTTKSASSAESSRASDNSDDETSTTTATITTATTEASTEKKEVSSTSEEKSLIDTPMEESVTEDTNRATNEEDANEMISATLNETEAKKNDGQAIDEETVLAVRALIEDDSNESGSKNDILNSWKPIDSDDECTILE